MKKKEEQIDCPFAMPKRDRKIIAKVGHIKREINTNNRLSVKSIERLKCILLAQSQMNDVGKRKDYFDKIYESIETYRNFDHLNAEQLFWVYELMEWAQWGIFEIDPASF